MAKKQFVVMVAWWPDYEEHAIRLVQMPKEEFDSFREKFNERVHIMCTFTTNDLKAHEFVGHEDFEIVSREKFEQLFAG